MTTKIHFAWILEERPQIAFDTVIAALVAEEAAMPQWRSLINSVAVAVAAAAAAAAAFVVVVVAAVVAVAAAVVAVAVAVAAVDVVGQSARNSTLVNSPSNRSSSLSMVEHLSRCSEVQTPLRWVCQKYVHFVLHSRFG